MFQIFYECLITVLLLLISWLLCTETLIANLEGYKIRFQELNSVVMIQDESTAPFVGAYDKYNDLSATVLYQLQSQREGERVSKSLIT